MASPSEQCSDAGFGAVSLDFTAIDFETANYQPGSACAVGLVRVRDGCVVDESGGLVRPPVGLGQFVDFKTSVHGITAEMVASAPPWRKVAAWIAHYAGQGILIAHNAGFNIGVLRHACTAEKIPWPQANFLCTMVLARKAFQLPSYRLPFVAAGCGVELVGRHQVLRLVTPDASTDANPEHPLYGRVIVFTGALKSRTRQQAWNDVAEVGAIPEKDVSGRTNILVIGDLNPAMLIPGATTSGKAARAFALQSRGRTSTS